MMKKSGPTRSRGKRRGSSDAEATAESIEKELRNTQEMCGDLFGNPSKEVKSREYVLEIRCDNAESAARIRETLNSATETKKKLSQTVEEYRNYRRDQERLVSAMKNELEKRNQTLQTLQNQRRIELSAWKSKFERASGSQLRRENEKLLSTMADMRTREGELRAMVSKLKASEPARQTKQQQRERRDLEKKIDTLQLAVGTLRGELSDKVRHCETLDTALTAAKVKLARAENEARRLRERNRILVDKDIAHLKGTVRNYQDEIATLRETVANLTTKRAKDADELDYLRERNASLQNLNCRLKAGFRESEIVKVNPNIVIATGTETAEQLRLANMEILALKKRALNERRSERESSSTATRTPTTTIFAVEEGGEKASPQELRKRVQDLERENRMASLELNDVRERLGSELDARLKMSMLVHRLLGVRSASTSARSDAMRLAHESTDSEVTFVNSSSGSGKSTVPTAYRQFDNANSRSMSTNSVAVVSANSLGGDHRSSSSSRNSSDGGNYPSENAVGDNDNVIVVFSHSFLGFTLVSTGDAQCPAIISAFQRFEDGSLGPAERCGTIGVGDALASIDGKSVRGMSYKRVVEELRGSRRPVVIEWTPKYYAPTRLVRIAGLNIVDHTNRSPSRLPSKSEGTTPRRSPSSRLGRGSRSSTPQTTPRKVSYDDVIFTPRSRTDIATGAQSDRRDFPNGAYSAWDRCDVDSVVSRVDDEKKFVKRDLLRGLRNGAVLKTWIESILRDESSDVECEACDENSTSGRRRSSFVQNLQRGIELTRLSPGEIEVFVSEVLSPLCGSGDLTLQLWQRQKMEIWTDLRLRVEHAKQPTDHTQKK